MSIDYKGRPAWNKGKPASWAIGNKNTLGKTPWNKGKKATEKERMRLINLSTGRKMTIETRIKMSLAHKGVKKTKQHKDNISRAKRLLVREGKHNWGNGIKTKRRKRIYNSRNYKNWRQAVFSRDKYKCQHCLKIGGYLEAHHIKPFSLFPKLRFISGNGITLCKECHIQTDTYGTKVRNSLSPDHNLQNITYYI